MRTPGWRRALLVLERRGRLHRSADPAAQRGGSALRVPYGGLEAMATSRNRPGALSTPWLLWIAWCLLCIAAARPLQWGEAEQPPRSARELMLAVDLSGSMSEEDMFVGRRAVDRLTAAKAVIADFLERRAGDRIGLIVFGQRAYAMTPIAACSCSQARSAAAHSSGWSWRLRMSRPNMT